MGGNWLFGGGLDAATTWTEFGLAWLVQSTAIIALGMLAAALVRRRHPAVLSVVYQTTLVAALAAPFVAYALASAGLTFVSLALPEARYEAEEFVEVLVAAEEPPAEVAAAPTPPPKFDNLERLEDEIEATSNPSSEPTLSISSGFPVEQPSFAPLNSRQPEVAVSPPALSVPPAPAEPIVRRVLQRVTRTHRPLAAVWFAIPAVWLAGTAFLLLRLVIDHLRLQHLRRSAVHADAVTIGIGLETARRMNVPLPELLRSPLVGSPCLCGLMRPAILLPEELDAEALPAVLLHELAHRKRGDLLWNLLRHVAVSLLWPQPLVWQLSRRLEAVAEDVCDDYVVALGGCPQSYAAALLAIAQRDLMPTEAAVSLVTFRSMLGQRVHRILDGSRGLSLTVGLAALVVIAAGGATAALMAGLLGPGRQSTAAVSDEPAAKAVNDSHSGEKEYDDDDLHTPNPAATDRTADDLITVRGTVLDPQGKPAAAARVNVLRYYWHGQRSDTPLATALTDSQGDYEISYRKSQFARNLARPEMWREAAIVATHDGYGPGWTHYRDVPEGKTTTLRLVEDQTVEGRIVDLEGRPIAGVTVQLESIYRHTQEDISRWVDAMRRGIPFFGSEDFGRPNDSVPGFGLPISGALVTGQDGTFTLRGIGKNRYATLKIRSPQCAAAELRVVTMPIESFEADFGQASYKNLLTFYGANFSFSAEPSQPIEGIVRDAATKQPLPGVRVYADQLAGKTVGGLYAAEAISDTQGRYRLHGLPKGDGNGLLAVPNDEQPYFMRELRDLPMADGLAPIQFNIELHRGIWITGRLSEEISGAPVQAHLYYLPWPDNKAINDLPEFNAGHLPGSHMRYETDADGRFRLVGLPGRGLVAANTLSVFPGGQGVREIKDLPPTEVFRKVAGVYAPTSTFPTAVHEVQLVGNADVEIDFRIESGNRIPVRFVDTEGKPASGLRVRGLQPKFKWHEDESVGPAATLLAFGSDETRLLLAHDEARSQGKAVLITPDRAKEQMLSIALEPCATLKARLLDPDGQPLPGLVIRLWPVGEQDWTVELPSASTDENGHFEAQLLPGIAYTVSAESAQINLRSLAKDLQVAAGETIDLGEFDVTSDERPEPKRTALTAVSHAVTQDNLAADIDVVTVRGTVLDPQGKPAAGTRVVAVAYQRESNVHWTNSMPPVISETRSRADGSYEISFRKSQCEKNVDGMDQWHFTTIAALHEKHAPAFNDYNLFEDPQAATLRLVEDEPVQGRIVNLEGQPIAGATVRLRGVGRNDKEDLSRWISAMRDGVKSFNDGPFDPPRHASNTLRFLSPGPVTTDADGRFTLAGLGKNRHAVLRLTGPGIALADLNVVTMPIENFIVEMGNNASKQQVVHHGSKFQFAAPPSQPVSGVVRDADSKQPIAGARVILDMLAGTRLSGVQAVEATTDANGRYELTGMPRGEGNQLLVIPPADQPYFMREFEDVPISDDFSPTTFDMELQRGIWITGRMTEQKSGKPLDARMYYLPWPDNPHIEGREQWHDNGLHGPPTNYVTDHEGRYRLVGLPGRGLVAAWCVRYPFPQGQGVREIADLPHRDVYRDIVGSFAPTDQFPTIVKEIRPAEDATEIEVDVTVHPGESLDVQFVDAAGRPVQDLTVQGVYPKATSSLERPEKHGPNVTLLGLKPDEKRLLIVHSEAARLGKAIHVQLADAEGGRMTVTLEPTVQVTGRLLDGAGDPLNTAQVTARPATEWNHALRLPSTHTDADGRFSLTLLAGCQYNISHTEPSFELASLVDELTVSPGETIDLGTIDVTSKERPEPKRTPLVVAKAEVAPPAQILPVVAAAPLVVRGVVLDPNGHPAAGVKLQAYTVDPRYMWGDTTDIWRKVTPPEFASDTSGRFAIALNKSTSELDNWPSAFPVAVVVATSAGAGPAWSQLTQENVGQDVELRLVQDQPIMARLVDLEGQPIADANIIVQSIETNAEEDQSRWLEALRGGLAYRSAESMRGNRKQLGFVGRWGLEVVQFVDIRGTTDADGRVQLDGIGRGRLANLYVSGPGRVTLQAKVVALPMDAIELNMASSFPPQQTLHGANFTLSLESSSPIEGTVRDADTGAPLASVRVVSDRFAGTNVSSRHIISTVSDAEGRYRLDGMPSGKGNRILAIPSADQPYFLREFDVPQGRPLAAVELDLKLHRGVFIEGMVRDAETKEAVLGQLYYLPWPDHPSLEALPELTRGNLPGPQDHYHTDAQGRYRIVGLPGRGVVLLQRAMNVGTVRAYPNGQGLDAIADLPEDEKFRRTTSIFTPRSQVVTAIKEVNAAAQGVTNTDIELREGERIALRLVDADGEPVTGARVRGLSPPGQFYDSEGLGPEVEVAGLAAGESRRLVIEQPARRLGRSLEISVANHGHGPVEVRLEHCATIKAQVLNDGEPVAGATIYLQYRTAPNYVEFLESTTDSEGRFSHNGVPPGVEFLVRCQQASPKPSSEILVEKLTAADGETIDLGAVDIAVDKRPEPKRTALVATVVNAGSQPAESAQPLIVRGVVLDPEGKPLAGAKVKMYRDSSVSKWAKDVPTMETLSGGDGRFEIDVPQVLSEGYRSGQPWPLSTLLAEADGVADTHLSVKDERAAANATIRMTPFAPLTGRIVNLEGQPVTGVKVQLHQVNVTESGDLGPYLAALRAGKPANEIDDATKPNMGFGDDAMRKANVATTDADGRFRLEQVGRHHIALLRLSGGGIVLTEIQVANVETEPVPFGDNSRQAPGDMLFGSPFEFAVEPSPPIVGFVTDAETLKPIAGVKIGSLRFEEMNKHGFGILETTTDKLGRYRLEGVRPKPSRGELQRFIVRSTGDVPYLPLEFDAPEAGADLAPIVHGIEMHRGVWIEGRVTDAVTGKPVAAKVEYLPWYDNPRVDRLPEYQGNGVIRLDPSMAPNTDDEGRFKLIGIPGRGIVQISHVKDESYPMGQGFDAIPDLAGAAEKFERLGRFNTPKPEQNVAIQELNIPDDATRVESNFELRPGTTVTLVAKDPNGKPVEVTEAFGLHPHHILRTHENPGDKIEVLGLSERVPRTVVLINSERRLGATIDINLKEDATPDRTVTLVPLAAITGRLVDASGEPLPAEKFEGDRKYIKLWSETHGRSMQVHATTPNEQGEFELLAAPGPIEYRVYASNARGDLAEKLSVESGETIDLGTIDGTARNRPPVVPKRTKAVAAAAVEHSAASKPDDTLELAGTVVGPDGKPIAGAKLYVLYYTPNAVETKPRATSGADGTFQFSMQKSEFDTGESNTPWTGASVVAVAPGHGAGWVALPGVERSGEMLKEIQARPNYVAVPEIISLESTIRLVADDVPLEGRLLSLEGQPIAGARVQVLELHGNPLNSLDAWTEAAEKPNVDIYQVNRHLQGGFAGRHLRQQVAQLFPATTTEADGRFRMDGVGRERIAMLRIEGDGIETRQVNVRTREGKTYELLQAMRDPDLGTLAYLGAKFELAMGPSREMVGTVLDAQTGEPLAGVTVVSDKLAGQKISGGYFNSVSAISDIEGKYRLRGLPVGENRIVAVPPKGQPHLAMSHTANVQLDSEPTADFKLPRGIWIRGRVTDSKTGKPIRAWVEYFAFRDNPASSKVDSRSSDDSTRVTTDAEGRFAVRGVPGRGIVGIREMNSSNYPLGVGADQITYGRDTDSGIIFTGDDGKTVVYRTKPSTCISSNFHWLKEIAPAEDDQEFSVDFALVPGLTARGIVLDPEGKPLAGAKLADNRAFNQFSPTGLRTADFEIPNFTAGEQRRVSFYHADRNLAGSRLLTGDEASPIEVKLAPCGAVAGRVLMASGEPADNVDLAIILFGGLGGGTIWGKVPDETSLRTDAEGRFRLEGLAADTPYALSAQQGRMSLGTVSEEFRIAAGETKDLGDMTIRPVDLTAAKSPSRPATDAAAGTLKANVLTFAGTVLGPDGKPHAGAKVTLPYRVEKERTAARATTAADGSFTLEVPRKDFAFAKHSFATILVEAVGLGIAWDYASPFETSGEMIAALPEHNRYTEFVTKAKTRTLKLVDDQAVAGRIVNLEGRPIAGAKVVVNAVHANHAEGLEPWLAAMQQQELGFQQGWRKLPDSFHLSAFDDDDTRPFAPVLTDVDGQFRIVSLGRDRLVSINVSGPGIETRELYFRTQAGEVLELADNASQTDGEVQTVYAAEFQHAAAPSLPLVGTVRDGDTGQPIAGVEITPESIAGRNLGGRPYRSMKAITDAEGRYRLEGLPIGENDIAAVPADDQPYPPVSLEVEMDSTKTETTLDFALKRGVWIRGRVTDGDTGEPVVSRVQYLPFSDNDHVRSVPGLYRSIDWKRTNDDGTFQIIGLPGHGLLTQMVGNNYEKYPRGGGHEKVTGAKMGELLKTFPYLSTPTNCHYMAELDVNATDAEVHHDVKLFAGATRQGSVLDSEGTPLAGAHCVGLKSVGIWDKLPTNEFAVNHLKAGEKRRLTFYHEERNLAGSVEIDGDDSTPITVKLQPAGTVTGLIRFQSGDLASRVELSGDRRSASPGLPHGPLPPGHPHLTSNDGQFTLKGLVPGLNYSVHASRSSYVIGNVFKDATVLAGETKDLGELTIPDPEN